MIGSDRTLYIKLNNKSRYDTKTQKQLCNKASAFIPFLLWKFHFPSSSQITHVHLYCRIFIGLTFTFFGDFSIFPNIFFTLTQANYAVVVVLVQVNSEHW